MDFSRDPQEEFAAEYAPMSEKELTKLSLEYGDLVEPARAAFRDELKKRGMEMPQPKPPEAVKAAEPSLYATMSNRKLLETARDYDKLPDASQTTLREEFASRGLEPPLIEEEAENDPGNSLDPQADALISDPVSDFVTVRTYRDLTAAYVARAYLEAEGIPNILRDENTIRTDWFLSNAIGGARLQVPSAHVERAEELLSDPIPDSFEASVSQEFVQPKCPKCGSLDVVADDMDRKIKAGSVVMFPLATAALSVLPFTPKADWKCMNCGCRWVDDGEPDPSDAAPLS